MKEAARLEDVAEEVVRFPGGGAALLKADELFRWAQKSSLWPLTASTILPIQSMLIPYSHRSPGSNRSGVVKAAFAHVVMPGVLVTLWYWAISGRQSS